MAQVAGSTSIPVITSDGYQPGDVLGIVDYVNPVPVLGVYEPAQVILRVVTAAAGVITFTPALPTGASIPSGFQFGFKGDASEWEDAVTDIVVKIRSQLADIANADAGIVVDFLVLAGAGRVTKAVADSPIPTTLTTTEASVPMIRATGAFPTVPRTLNGFPLPTTEAEYYTRFIHNDCTGQDLVIATASGTTTSLTAGQRAIVGFSTAGASLFL